MAEIKAITRIQYAYPIESLSRKFTLRRNTASATKKVKSGDYSVTIDKEVSRYFGGGVRETFVKGLGKVKKNYVFIRFNQRESAPSEEELAARTAFGNAAKLVNQWKRDVTTLPKIQEAWHDEATVAGFNPVGYTLHQWLFNIALAVLEAGGSTVFPYN